MEYVPATLQLDLDDSGGIRAVDAGRALIAWADAVQLASQIIDPAHPIAVELIGTETACIRLHAVLRFLEERLTKADSTLAPYPKLRAALALNVFSLPGMILGGAAGAGLFELGKYLVSSPSASVQAAAEDATNRLQASPSVRHSVNQFYRTVDAAPTVTGIRIYEQNPEYPLIVVPRELFPFYSGLWTVQEMDEARRPRQDVWDVIVTHPVIIGRPRVWRFKRDGAPFKAKLADPFFLAAIRERTLPMQVAEGTLMRVRVEWFEDLISGEWVADPRSFVVSKVLWPAPLRAPLPLPLFPEPSGV